MRVDQRTAAAVSAALEGSGIRVKIGPVVARITSRSPWLSEMLYSVAGRFELASDEVADVHLDLRPAWSVFRPFARAMRVTIDGGPYFGLVSAEQLPRVLDCAIQAVIAERFNCWLLLCGYVVERNGKAVLLQFADGSATAALLAQLADNGYRVVSAELCLLELESLAFLSLPRFTDTGDANAAPVRVSGILLLESAGQVFGQAELLPAEAFRQLAANSVNYEVLGEAAFSAMCNLLDSCRIHRLDSGDLRGVTTVLKELTDAD